MDPMERNGSAVERAVESATDTPEPVETVEIARTVEIRETGDILRRLWEASMGNLDLVDASSRRSPRMGVDTPLRPAH